ncbi:MAG: Endonuclease 4 [Chlamydiae bacterium]|nr:Endonuclease 4 [Chlamydiota bacterium]
MALGEELLVGAHTSVAGGLHNALERGQEIGANTIQIFTRNQRQWNARPISEEEISLWKGALETSGIQKVMSHASYLINLGSNKDENLLKSRAAFKEEIERCQCLELAFLNFHPGAATGDSEENCLNRIVESLLEMAPLLEKSSLRLLLEATAGQGTTVGNTFEHLAYIIERVKGKLPIGVCIDTCHIFAAGYDIRDESSWNATLTEYDKIVGLGTLFALHVNDSKYPLGSRRDRHASLGKGEIGAESFRVMMRDQRLQAIPKYLETPVETIWKDEIRMLRDYASKNQNYSPC